MTELLKLQKSGQFPDEPVRIRKNRIDKISGASVSAKCFFSPFRFFFLWICATMRRRPVPAERAAASAEMMRQMQQIKPEHLPPVHVVIYQVVIHANPEAC
jgi:hypothetical protein